MYELLQANCETSVAVPILAFRRVTSLARFRAFASPLTTFAVAAPALTFAPLSRFAATFAFTSLAISFSLISFATFAVTPFPCVTISTFAVTFASFAIPALTVPPFAFSTFTVLPFAVATTITRGFAFQATDLFGSLASKFIQPGGPQVFDRRTQMLQATSGFAATPLFAFAPFCPFAFTTRTELPLEAGHKFLQFTLRAGRVFLPTCFAMFGQLPAKLLHSPACFFRQFTARFSFAAFG